MRRALALLLSAYLSLWVPLNFAIEALTTMPSLGTRGPLAFAELAMHGIVALLCAIAGRMVWNHAPSARPLAAAAIVGNGIVALQSIFATVLPRDIAPGNQIPLAALAATVAIVCLVMIWRIGPP
jgi:hypothetical protein